MTIAENAGYLASLISILDSFDDGGGRTRPKWLAEEYERAYLEFRQNVEKENEARTRTDSSSKSQGRAQEPSGQPGRSQSIGPRSGLA